jgi:hypothetical protein
MQIDELEEYPQDYQEPTLPRWIQLPVGIFLAIFLLPCLVGSLALVFHSNDKAPLLAPAFGALMAVVCLWGFGASIRLIIGKRVHGGLFGPRTLRVVGWFFLLLPIGGLFTGYFVTHTVQALVQTAAYVGVFCGLRKLATDRESDRDLPLQASMPERVD